MRNYFKSIWRCRYFWFSLIKLDLRRRYRRSVLGLGWSLLHPIVVALVLCTVFHKILHNNVREYLPFLLTGLACWNFFVTVTSQGCQCFFQGESYIRQHPAPLAIYPLRVSVGVGFHFLIALTLALAVAGCMNGLTNPLSLLSLIPSVALIFLFGWSLALLAGCANVHFPDTQHLCDVGFQVLFFATPVMYGAELLRDNRVGWLADYNPLVAFLQIVRDPIVNGRVPEMSTFAMMGTTVFLAMGAAGITLARLQKRLIFYL